MAGQGHQFPSNFQGNAAGMRSGFGGGPMSGQMQSMPNQLSGVMGGPMANTGGMVGMGNQMVPPYGATMQNQMGNMGMGPQGMGVGVSGGPGGPGMGPQTVQQSGGMQAAGAVSNNTAPPPAQPPAPQPPQNKEFNTASLCKFGQETVQDIVSRTQDVFQTLKAIQPPNGTHNGENASNDKKAKMQEQLRTIRLLFKRLRLIYEKCNETCQGMEYTHMESLIPLKDEAENKALDERRNTESYRLALEENRELTEQVIFNDREYICRPCWLRGQRAQGQGAMQDPLPGPSTPLEDAVGNLDQDEVPQQLQQPDLLQSLNLSDLSRAPNTSNACIFYGCRMISRRRIPDRVKADILINANYYVPPSARVCDEHLQTNNWEELFEAPNRSHDFSSAHIMDIISILKNVITNTTHMDFEHVENMPADELHYWTGRTHEEFNIILAETPSLSRRSTHPKKILGMYLSKLRSGESDDRLATLYGISRRHFERLIHLAQECLLEDFVPQHLGFDHLTRQQAVNRNLVIPAALFGNPNAPDNEMPAITIIDGTYQNIQKSANYLFQRDTYSPHKYRNLIKPLVLTCSDGYIIDIYGPYKATKSDASIMQDIIQDEQDAFHFFFRSGDVFILDRGFRDALPDFRSFEYTTHTPESLHPGESQLTTMQANKSRKVTMVRWVVEIVFGRIKRDFKLLRQEYFNVSLKHLFPNFRIAAALLNAFHMPVHDSVYADRFIANINHRINMPNNLAEYVLSSNMNRRRAAFTPISGNLPQLREFPRLSEEDLIIFALGTYQLKLARSYYSEHVRDGVYKIDIFRDGAPSARLEQHNIREQNLILLRGRIQSRHVRSRTHYTYVMYREEAPGLDAIRHYYCSCLSGKRTLGCCAHIMTIIWYLGWARYQDQIRHPAAFLNHILIE